MMPYYTPSWNFCATKQMHYLSTFFMTLFQRDRSWESIQDWFNAGDHFVPSQPQIDSTLPILIPCHVHGSHWVGIVRRVLNGTVHFFYADDLNLNNIENALQTFLFTHSDRRFYPANAIWTHCNSITFRQHSNECGPRTLLALTIMGSHPLPTADTLMPFMSPNLVQTL
jgi:hypothetical protein